MGKKETTDSIMDAIATGKKYVRTELPPVPIHERTIQGTLIISCPLCWTIQHTNFPNSREKCSGCGRWLQFY